MSLIELIEKSATQLENAGLAFGHGTQNAFDEAAWLVLWQLGLPLDTPLDGQTVLGQMPVTQLEQAQVAVLLEARTVSRKPAAYLTQEAWLQGVPFYVDERAIVPRSFIAELLVDGTIDAWLGEEAHRVLDLCTGNGSLAVLAAMAYPDVQIDATDISGAALAVAQINVEKHALKHRIKLLRADGLPSTTKPYDLILCNPPYVNAESMALLPAEYRAEPALALDGNSDGGTDGMDFIRRLLRDAPARMTADGVLVLEVGNERRHFEAAFPKLEVVWLPISAGSDQVLLVTANALRAASSSLLG
jgi:ribosomal protein L3 glutamine methyltransferase